MNLATEQPSISELRSAFLKRLLVFALIANLLIAGLAAFFLLQSKALYQSRAETTTQNLARSLADHISGEVDTIDLTLLLVADEVEEELARGGLDGAELTAFLTRHKERLRFVDGMRITTADGVNAYGTGITPGVRSSIADRPYFIQLRDNPKAGLVISDPIIQSADQRRFVVLARRFKFPEGSFAGIVSGAVTLQHFTTTFSAIALGQHGSISLRDTNLTLIARNPEPVPELIGKRNASPELIQGLQQHPEASTYRSKASFDQIDRTYSYHKVANSALYVIVGMAAEEYLAAWYREATWTVALVLVFVLGTCLSSSVIYRGFMRQALATQTLAQQKQSLRKSQAELEAISDSTPVMMCLVNSQHQAERMNRAMTEFTKDTIRKVPCSVGGLLGCISSLETGCGLGDECGACPLRMSVHKTLNTGQPCRQVEVPLTMVKAGVQQQLYLSVSTSLVHLGHETKVLVCLENTTAQKQLASQLFQVQKMDAIGQLAGGVAHDFNNILATFLMNVGLLKSTPNLDPEVLSGLDELEELSQRATRLTRQLLVFSRRQVLQTGRVDMHKVVAGLMKMLGRLLGEQIQISVPDANSASDGLWIDADAGMMEQVVLNLCVNARDAMPKGGRLTMTLETVTVDQAQAEKHQEARPGRFVCLTVADTGCGMDKATVKHIFEPFFTTKAVGKGTGLGLATVYGIVQQHKGWIQVESALGSGTTFRVFLPVSEEERNKSPLTLPPM